MMNGSSATGHCSSVNGSAATSACTAPTSSVLFDGVIPTLTGLDGDMWASQLLTLKRKNSLKSNEASFAFTQQATFQLVRVELVIFNCQEWGISVQSISLGYNGTIIGSSGDLNSITSCDSLVRLCVLATAINPLVVRLQFDLNTGSNWTHLAEVTFYDDSTTCPPDTIITTEMNTATNTHPGPTTPTTITQQATAPPTTTESDTTPDNGTATDGTTDKNAIIPAVVVICVVFMIVGIMAAVLIQWRYHKHKTSHGTALGEGHSHAHTHSHPQPVNKYEETGQVCYSSPPEALGQLSPSHDTYSHLQ